MKIKCLILLVFFATPGFLLASFDGKLLKKRWKVNSHTKKSKSITHHQFDFFQFNADNTVEKVTDGIHSLGKWSFENESGTLNLQFSDINLTWTVAELTTQKLKCIQGQENWELESVTLPVCNGDPYDDFTMICGKWKIADHMANYSRVTHNIGDYIYFFPDGTVETVIKGKYNKSSWKYENNQLVMENITWNIRKLDQKQLNAEIKSKNESWVLKK